MSPGLVIDFSDDAIFAMSIANVAGLYLLMGSVKADLKDYQSRVASGEIKRYKLIAWTKIRNRWKKM